MAQASRKFTHRMSAYLARYKTRNDKTPSSSAACSMVFQTFELVELILSHLPPKDLFRSQRVCKGFREVLQRSLSLKRTLHLEPDWSLTGMSASPIAPPFITVTDDGGGGIGSNIQGQVFVPQTPRPLKHSPKDQPHQSWRRIFPAQPPLKQLHLTLTWGEYIRKVLVLKLCDCGNAQGITFGMMVDAMWKYIERTQEPTPSLSKVLLCGLRDCEDIVFSDLMMVGCKETKLG